MPLFGPFGVGLANALFGVTMPAGGFELQSGMQPPFSFPYGYPFMPTTQQTVTPTPTPAPAASTSAAPAPPPPPPMQSIGTFTTRRTQLFGPLGAVSI